MGQDKKDTKGKILKAARNLFVEKGFNGASMGAIRDEAGVNHALLFYYFKSKEKLWEAVKADIVEGSKIAEKVIPKDKKLSVQDFIRGFVENFAKLNVDNPDNLSLINWQRLEPTQVKVGASDTYKAFFKAFGEYQDRGEIRKDVRVEFIVYSILALLTSAAMDDCIFISNDEERKQYIDYVAETSIRMATK